MIDILEIEFIDRARQGIVTCKSYYLSQVEFTNIENLLHQNIFC